jgi:hypothetical protein
VGVAGQSVTDWYCLLRGCQGSLSRVIKSGYLLNCVRLDGSLPGGWEPCWQEYAYIVNFDEGTFDFYVGKEKEKGTPLGAVTAGYFRESASGGNPEE